MCKTLIVEDDRTFRHLLKDMLCEPFPAMIIEEAADGKQALHKVDHFLPDLIFMDINLPDANGLDLTRKIKHAYPAIIIVIITNCDVEDYRDAALRYGAAYCIIKNAWSSDQIVALVRSIEAGMHNG